MVDRIGLVNPVKFGLNGGPDEWTKFEPSALDFIFLYSPYSTLILHKAGGLVSCGLDLGSDQLQDRQRDGWVVLNTFVEGVVWIGSNWAFLV